MTESAAKKERFIELRASGMTLAQAARELDIAYNTAVNWQKEFNINIQSAKAIKMEELLDKYQMTKKKRIELFGKRLEVIQKELVERDRDLSDVSTPKLFEMLIKCCKVLEAETDIPELMSEEEIENIRRDWKILDANKDRRREERDKMLSHL